MSETQSLFEAVKANDAKAVRRLLKVGVDINAQDENGSTALMLATDRKLENIVKILVKANADVNILVEEGWTALMFAVNRNLENIVKILLKAGADVNAKSGHFEWTALMIAANRDLENIVKILLEAGADPNAVSYTYKTALILASRRLNIEIITILLDFGADVNAQDEDDDSVLVNTIFVEDLPNNVAKKTLLQKNIKEIVDILLGAGADPNLQSEGGCTALEFAAQYKFDDVAESLLYFGADPDDGSIALKDADKNIKKMISYKRTFDNNEEILGDNEYELDLKGGFIHINGGCFDLEFSDELQWDDWREYV